MKKRKVNRLLAVVLAAAMAISPATAGAATDGIPELFLDGFAVEEDTADTETGEALKEEFEEDFEETEEMPLFEDGEDVSDAEMEIESEFVEAAEEALPVIAGITLNMTEITGYYEYGGRDLQRYLKALNPEVTVSFEGEVAKKTVNYNDGLEGYGAFHIYKEGFIGNQEKDPSDIANPGDYTFKIVNESDHTILSNDVIYHLISAKGVIPEIPELITELSFKNGNYGIFYACQIRNQGFPEREFHIKFDNSVSIDVYDEVGNWVEAGNAFVYDLVIPNDKIRNIVIKQNDPAVTSLKMYLSVSGGASESEYALTNTGSYTMNLTAGAVTYTFTAPEDGYYRFAGGCDYNFIVAEDGRDVLISGAQKMQRGKTYRLKGHNNLVDSAITVTVDIENVPYVTGIEVTDTQERFVLWERLGEGNSLWDNEAMGERLLIHLSDGSTVERVRRFVEDVYINEELGKIKEHVYDKKTGNLVEKGISKQPCGEYEIEFYWEKDPSVFSEKRVPYKIESVADLKPKYSLSTTQPVKVTRNYNGMFVAEIQKTNKMGVYEITSSYSPQDIKFYGVFELVSGNLIRQIGGTAFLAEQDKTYYAFVAADNKDITEIDLSLREIGPRIQSIEPAQNYGTKTVVNEFVSAWWPEFLDYEFNVTYTDPQEPIEIVNHFKNSKYYGALKSEEVIEENGNESYVKFFLSNDPEMNFCRVDFNLLHIEEMGSDIVTGITQTGENIALTTYEADGNAYFSFTAPEKGMYKFSGFAGFDVNCIQKQIAGDYSYWGGADASRVMMEAGETIYGRTKPVDDLAVVTAKYVTLPEIESIVLVNEDGEEIDNLKCNRALSGVCRYAGNWLAGTKVFAGNLFRVTYENGESDIVETESYEKKSRYYGNIFTNRDYSKEFGECTVNFNFVGSKVTSKDFTFTIDDEREVTLPAFSKEGTYTVDYNYNNYACFVFNPSEDGNYRFKINDGIGGVDYFSELILTYPRDYRSSTDVNDEWMPVDFKTRSKTWMDLAKAGESVCVAISLKDRESITLQIEKISEFKRIDLPNLPLNYIEEFDTGLEGIQNIKLHFTEGVKEEFIYRREESAYYGELTIRGEEKINGEGSNYKLVAFFDDYPEYRTIYEVNRIPLSEAKLPTVTMGNEITKIEFANETERYISGTYIQEFIERWDGMTDDKYFAGCEFKVSYSTGDPVTVKYGDIVPGYGEIRVIWPRNSEEPDNVDIGKQKIAFAPAGSDEKCECDVEIKRAKDAGLATVGEDGKLNFVENGEDPGNTRYFQYKPEVKAVYSIEFMDPEETVPVAYLKTEKTAGEVSAEQTEIKIGNRTMIAPVRNGSKIYVAADADETIYGAYSGKEKGVKITRLDDADNLYSTLVVTPEGVKVLYGDTKYQFNDWSFHYGENGTTFGYGEETEFGTICCKKDGDIKPDFKIMGRQEVIFYPERNEGLETNGYLEIVTGDQLGIKSVSLGAVYDFNSQSLYDGNQAAYFNAAEEGYYSFEVEWNSGEERELEVVSAATGNTTKYTEDIFITTLVVNNYTFINRNGSVKSIKITKINNEALVQLYNECVGLDSNNYTAASWETFKTVLDEIELILNNPKSLSQEAINAAYDKLGAVKNSLVTKLVELSERCESLNKHDYTSASWRILESAWNKAKEVLANTDATQADITKAYDDLNAGFNGLVKNTWTPPTDPIYPPTTPTPSPIPPPPVPDENGTIVDKDGTVIMADGTAISKGEGTKAPVYDKETGKTTIEEGNEVLLASGDKVTPPAGSVVEKDGSVTEPDGTVIKPDGTVCNTDGSKQNLKGEYLSPAKPILKSAEVYSTGNQVKAVLTGECAGAEGYDYVISKNINCIKDKDYYQISKNQLRTDTAFRYIPKGTYYAGLHAHNRTSEDGKKVFSPWSNNKTVKVTGK